MTTVETDIRSRRGVAALGAVDPRPPDRGHARWPPR